MARDLLAELRLHEAGGGLDDRGLETVIATCESHGVNPFAYLADVITRVQDHPVEKSFLGRLGPRLTTSRPVLLRTTTTIAPKTKIPKGLQ